MLDCSFELCIVAGNAISLNDSWRSSLVIGQLANPSIVSRSWKSRSCQGATVSTDCSGQTRIVPKLKSFVKTQSSQPFGAFRGRLITAIQAHTGSDETLFYEHRDEAAFTKALRLFNPHRVSKSKSINYKKDQACRLLFNEYENIGPEVFTFSVLAASYSTLASLEAAGAFRVLKD